ADRPLADLRRKSHASHDSILSRLGVSGKPGAVQVAELVMASPVAVQDRHLGELRHTGARGFGEGMSAISEIL
ncbi:MAG: hypothetical protein CSA62_01480, partial [Planctomycetota bacterium]